MMHNLVSACNWAIIINCRVQKSIKMSATYVICEYQWTNNNSEYISRIIELLVAFLSTTTIISEQLGMPTKSLNLKIEKIQQFSSLFRCSGAPIEQQYITLIKSRTSVDITSWYFKTRHLFNLDYEKIWTAAVKS